MGVLLALAFWGVGLLLVQANSTALLTVYTAREETEETHVSSISALCLQCDNGTCMWLAVVCGQCKDTLQSINNNTHT